MAPERLGWMMVVGCALSCGDGAAPRGDGATESGGRDEVQTSRVDSAWTGAPLDATDVPSPTDASATDVGAGDHEPLEVATIDADFALEFGTRAGAAMAAAAPPWTCATSLPAVPVADAAAAHAAVNQFIAQVVGVPATDIAVSLQPCGPSLSADCAVVFAHDTAKSGGAIYDTAWPLAQELEASAAAIEVAAWTPMRDGLSLEPAATMSGIAGGLLVGLVVFYDTYPCH
jgi:hypothetical protein